MNQMPQPDPTLTRPVRIVRPAGDDENILRYSIASLVTDWTQHDAMRASFEAHGFGLDDCEFLAVDNAGDGNTSAYVGLNLLLDVARARYVILCHQDVRLRNDDRRVLDRRLTELDEIDPAWGLAGNAGGVAPGRLALRLSDPHEADQRVGPFPARVASLDENFIVVRRGTRIGFSSDLAGFHFYGADICLMADIAGYSAYVVDFHVDHLSGGTTGRSFTEMEDAFRAKWSRALRPRWIQTTCSLVRVTGARAGRVVGRVAERPYARLLRLLHSR